jgi:hypothetical protein
MERLRGQDHRRTTPIAEGNVDARLWNIGMKVKDVQAEVDYFVELGGRLRVHERLSTPDGEFEYALVDFADTRLFLTPKSSRIACLRRCRRV